MLQRLTYGILIASLIAACSVDATPDESEVYALNIPQGFDAPVIPEDNPLNAAKIALGKKLFYDKALSIDSTISCGSCHKAEYGFADHVAISHGVQGRLGFRNAPTLTNIAYAPVMSMDGGNPTLETQPYIPIETHEEMGFNMALLSARLQENADYVAEFNTVFGKGPDPFGITRALAAFERTMISGNSRFDQYYYQGNTQALSESEKRGLDLFFSAELGCANCHSGFLFTDYSFACNGFFDDYSTDPGRARITVAAADSGKFKVPTLRNIGLTAPYMHNGSAATLEEVIDQYMTGGSGYVNQSELIQSFTLTVEEKNDLIAFLLSLTDFEFTQNAELLQ